MTESKAKAPQGMHTITPHIVVGDAAAVMQVELHGGANQPQR